MIQVHGLTQHQHNLLDKLWSLDSLESVEEWMATLEESDQVLAQSLAQLLILEQLDQIQSDNFSECDDARTLLERIGNKNH